MKTFNKSKTYRFRTYLWHDYQVRQKVSSKIIIFELNYWAQLVDNSKVKSFTCDKWGTIDEAPYPIHVEWCEEGED